jgi:hypothetical protein
MIVNINIEQYFYFGGRMPKKSTEERNLEQEIAQLRGLLKRISEKTGDDMQREELLQELDSVARAAPQLAALLKAQRDLANGELDPTEILREALAELEEEWPELHECKERLRGGGKSAEEEKKE